MGGSQCITGNSEGVVQSSLGFLNKDSFRWIVIIERKEWRWFSVLAQPSETTVKDGRGRHG